MILSIDDWLVLSIDIEVLIVTMVMLYFCVKEKAKPVVFFGVIAVFTILILFCSLPLLELSNSIGRGNGLFLIVGFLYLVPLRYLIKEPFKKTFTVLGFVWFYSMLQYSISVHITRAITASNEAENFMVIWLAIQSGLFLLSIFFYFKFLRKRFIPLIENMDKENYPILTLLSILWFSFTLIGNYVMITTGSSQYDIFVVAMFFVIGLCAFITYSLFYSFIFSKKMVSFLTSESLKDSITGLKNRRAFLQDANKLIEKKTTFSFIFIDLDLFKNINDKYGHLCGDRYLALFGKVLEEELQYSSTVYRIYGDEFALIYYGDNIEEFSNRLAEINVHDMPDEMPYLGFSFGYSSFPSDGATIEKLLTKADEKMYRSKSLKEKKSV